MIQYERYLLLLMRVDCYLLNLTYMHNVGPNIVRTNKYVIILSTLERFVYFQELFSKSTWKCIITTVY